MKHFRLIFADIIFVVIIGLLVLMSVLSYKRIADLNDLSDRVTHTGLVKLRLEQALSFIKDAETSQRGYLISKDSAFLKPYASSFEQTRATVGIVDSLTRDNIDQQNNLRVLRSLIRNRFKRLNLLIQSAGDSNLQTRHDFIEGNRIMADLRVAVANMIRHEDELLNDRTMQKDQLADITPLYLLLFSIAAIVIVGLAYARLRNETQMRFKAENNEAKIQDFFAQVPAMLAILKGPDHLIEFANPMYHDFVGQAQLVGKSIVELAPESTAKYYRELLDKVYTEGGHFTGKEMPVNINYDPKNDRQYVNITFKAYKDAKGQPVGILVFCYDVSELVQTRKKIEEVELRSRLAIEAADMGTFDWDLVSNNFNSSPRLKNIFGFNGHDDLLHQQFINTFHPDDKPIRDKAVAAAFPGGALEYEARIFWPDKSVHWVNVFGKVMYSDDHQPLRMHGTVIDISRQKRILEELQESEAKFRLLADSMPQNIWTGDATGTLNYFNKSLYNYSGLTLDELNTLGWVNIIHPDDREENIHLWKSAVETGQEFMHEHRIRKHSGEYRWQLSRALPQKDQDGNIQMWVGTSTDIDDQKNFTRRLEEKITERTHELHALNKQLVMQNNIFIQAEENALIGSYVWNVDTLELKYSDNLFRLLGYQPGAFVPTFEKYLSLIHPDDLQQVISDGEATLRTRTLVENMYRVITPDHVVKYFRSSGTFITDGGDQVLIGTVQDVSKDALMNEVLKTKNLELERSNTELESFNYVASHDLQEPLRKIQAFSQRILDKERANFSNLSQDYFQRIIRSAERMQNLIDALISYSKTSRSDIDHQSTNLNVLLEEVTTDLQNLIDEKHAQIIAEHLPTIDVIPLQVHQLLVNLISNAIKYSKPTVAPVVRISCKKLTGTETVTDEADTNKQYWAISIADNGIGFEQQFENKIFELFQRLHGQSDYVGTGIGLAICKKIMLNHRGFIRAKGNEGAGAEFSIYFPVDE